MTTFSGSQHGHPAQGVAVVVVRTNDSSSSISWRLLVRATPMSSRSADRLGRVAAAAHAAEGGHAGVVPAVDDAVLDELRSLRFEVTVWVSSRRANSVCSGCSCGRSSCSRHQS
jgi:hypothetical protein